MKLMLCVCSTETEFSFCLFLSSGKIPLIITADLINCKFSWLMIACLIIASINFMMTSVKLILRRPDEARRCFLFDIIAEYEGFLAAKSIEKDWKDFSANYMKSD